MREIKFRAWDKEAKRMLLPTGHLSYCPISEDWIVKATTSQDQDGKWRTKLEEVYGTLPMQFTGLHDKNGKEIYEGDIIATKQKDVLFEILHGWNGDGDAYGWNYKSLRSPRGQTYSADDPEHLEIIGNIHENPDLLKA